MIGTGTTLSWESLSGLKILSIDPPNPSVESIDTSHMESSGERTFVPGDLVDYGEVRIELQFEPGTVDLYGKIGLAPSAAVITFPDTATLTFNAFATGWEPSAALEELATGTLTLKVTGGVTVA